MLIPTRNGEAPLLAARPRRWASVKSAALITGALLAGSAQAGESLFAESTQPLYEQRVNIELNEQRRSVRVESDGALILDLEEFPVVALKTQLRAWLESVDDMSPSAFVFNSQDPSWHGVFRIEPRSERWQFTSWKERVRSSELLSIEEWRSVLRRSGV